MRRVFNILLVVMNFPVFSQTGSISGHVYAKGKGIEFVVVGIMGTNFSATTNSKGDFLIEDIPFGKYEMQIAMVGYDKVKRNVLVNKQETVYINQEIIESQNSLNEIVVTGTLQEITKSESAIPVDILTPKLFQKNPTPNLFESMQMINGVQPQLNCNVCNTGDIHINGMEGPYTMVTIDGMPIVSALSTVYGLSGIPNSLVNRVEVVKGPASTLYGSEAVAGLINIITKNPIGAPKVSADVFVTSDLEYNTDLGIKFSKNKVHSLLGINYYNFQNILDDNNDGFTDLTLQNRISVFNKWSFERKNNRVANIAARFVYEDRWGGQTQWEKKWRGTDSVYGESIFTSRYEVIGNYQLPIDKEKIFFQYSFNTHDQNSYYGTTPFMANQTIAFGQLYWNKKISDSLHLLVGLPFRYTYYDDNTIGTQYLDSMNVVNKPQQTYLPGLFVQTELKHKQLTALAGLRFDYNTNHGTILSPRLAVKYSFKKDNIFRLSAGNGYRVVNLFTEDHAALTGAREVVIKNNLKPEKSWNANINYQRLITFTGAYVELDASLFYTYFSNKIIGDFLTDPDKIIFDNISGYAISEGASLNANIVFVNGIKANLGATYMEVYSKQKDSLGDLIKTPQLHAPKYSFNFALSYTLAKYNLSVDYTGNVKSPMHLPVVPNDFRPEQSPWFAIHNLQFTKKFKKGLEIYLGVKNILDFVPQNPILRPFDPFDKHIDENNPNGYTFDPSYNYSSLQGRRYFVGVRYNLY